MRKTRLTTKPAEEKKSVLFSFGSRPGVNACIFLDHMVSAQGSSMPHGAQATQSQSK